MTPALSMTAAGLQVIVAQLRGYAAAGVPISPEGAADLAKVLADAAERIGAAVGADAVRLAEIEATSARGVIAFPARRTAAWAAALAGSAAERDRQAVLLRLPHADHIHGDGGVA